VLRQLSGGDKKWSKRKAGKTPEDDIYFPTEQEGLPHLGRLLESWEQNENK